MADQKPYFKGIPQKPVNDGVARVTPQAKAKVIGKVVDESKKQPPKPIADVVVRQTNPAEYRRREKARLANVTTNVTVKTPYGDAVIPYKGFKALEPDEQTALLAKMRAEVIANEDAKRKPAEKAKPEFNPYQTYAPVDVNAETLKNLQSLESGAMGANPIYSKADQWVQSAQKSNESEPNKVAQFAKSIGLGLAENALHPVSTFANSTGNLFDPNASFEEFIGAAGNAAIAGTSALPVARGAIAAGQVLGKEGAKAAVQAGAKTFAREAIPFGENLFKDAPKVNDLVPSAVRQDVKFGQPGSFEEFRKGTKSVEDLGAVRNPDGTAKFMPKPKDVPVIEAPKPMVSPKAEAKAAKASAVESGDDLVGYAKQITGNDPLPGVNRDQLLKAGEDAIATGKVNPDAYVDDVIKKGMGNGDEQATVASLVELRRIRNRQLELEKMDTPEAADEWTKLQERADKYVQAGDLIGNDWHRMGIALQVAIKQDMSLGALESRGKLLNGGQNVPENVKEKFQKLSEDHAKALKEIEKLKSNNADVMERIKSAPVGRLSVSSRDKARSVAADYFAGKKLEPTGGVGKNRQRGAVSYTITPEEIRAKSAIRKLAKEIALDGAETLDDVLNGIRKEIGVNVKDEDLLAFIYEPYTKYRIEADVARIKANQALSDVQRAAEFRAKSLGGKTLDVVKGTVNGVQRSFQMGMDFSAPMIQGRKGITTNPVGWLKSYAPMFRATVGRRSNDVALKELARIEGHPMYSRAKAAGLDITTPGGKFSAQEEAFAGNIGRILEVMESQKGIKRAAGLPAEAYLNLLQRSEDAFTTYMNSLRYDTFIKMAKVAPDDPAYLKDVANLTNVIYGRGAGDIAKAAGKMGDVFLAPRYLVSQLQFSSGMPLFTAKTAAGRAQAAKTYGKYVAGVTSLMYAAKLAGWEVGNDPRATDFGRISKDGIAIDVFGKEGQFIKLGMQNLYGKISQKGNYMSPTGYGSNAENFNYQFLQGKLAPAGRLASEIVFGVFGEDGKKRPVQVDDFKLKLAPLWVQDAVKEADKWKGKDRDQALSTLVGIFGLDVKPRDIANPSIPIEYTKPGIYGKN